MARHTERKKKTYDRTEKEPVASFIWTDKGGAREKATGSLESHDKRPCGDGLSSLSVRRLSKWTVPGGSMTGGAVGVLKKKTVTREINGHSKKKEAWCAWGTLLRGRSGGVWGVSPAAGRSLIVRQMEPWWGSLVVERGWEVTLPFCCQKNWGLN